MTNKVTLAGYFGLLLIPFIAIIFFFGFNSYTGDKNLYIYFSLISNFLFITLLDHQVPFLIKYLVYYFGWASGLNLVYKYRFYKIVFLRVWVYLILNLILLINC